MEFGFTLFLTLLVVLTGAVALWDVVKRRQPGYVAHGGMLMCRGLFPLLLLVLLVRAFLVQPYRVPTGSLEPTIMPGDFIAVSQYDYGLRLPLMQQPIKSVGLPQHGDVALFHWPLNPGVTYIKRVVALPGDRVRYHNKQLFINGKACTQRFVRQTVDQEPGGGYVVNQYREQCPHYQNDILINPAVAGRDFEVTIPPAHYFVMGDNRDNSNDSRTWGSVAESEFIGRARWVWMSWDQQQRRVDWRRIGTRVS